MDIILIHVFPEKAKKNDYKRPKKKYAEEDKMSEKI
jgi:hypothetical protein